MPMLIQTVFGLVCGDIEVNIQGVKTGVHSKHVRAHTWYLHTLFLAHNVPKYRNKPSNIIKLTSQIIKTLTKTVPGEFRMCRIAYRHVGLDITIIGRLANQTYLLWEFEQPIISVESWKLSVTAATSATRKALLCNTSDFFSKMKSNILGILWFRNYIQKLYSETIFRNYFLYSKNNLYPGWPDR